MAGERKTEPGSNPVASSPFPTRRLSNRGKGANLFFHFVSRGYERDSIIITNNRRLGAWGEVFIWHPAGNSPEFYRAGHVAGKGAVKSAELASFARWKEPTTGETQGRVTGLPVRFAAGRFILTSTITLAREQFSTTATSRDHQFRALPIPR